MADWRALLEQDGLARVRTLLASGNAVFEAPPRRKPAALARAIEKALADALGITTRATVLAATELRSIAEENPLRERAAEAARLLICVAAAPEDHERLCALARRDWGVERFVAGERAAYLWSPRGVADSAVFAALQKELGAACTTRNLATWEKLIALAEDRG
jgi:uncharacterized protein (DUF1697 family)